MTKKEKFITQSIEKFGDKFDYSKVTDINNKEIDKITIICPIHGEFETTPKSFLISKYLYFCFVALFSAYLTNKKENIIEQIKII